MKRITHAIPFRSATLTPIGLDVGSHSVKAAQLRHQGERWTVDRLAVFPRLSPSKPIEGAEVARIRSVLGRLGFRGHQLVLSLPPQLTLTAMLDLPPRAPGVPIDQIARTEFARMHSRQADQLETSFWDLPEPSRGAKGTRLMCVGTPKTEAEQLLDLFSTVGLSVVALDHFTSAVCRACSSMGPATSNTTLVVDLGWSAATLALVSSGMLIYERRMPEIAGRLLHESLQKQFSMDAEEAALVMTEASLAAATADSNLPGLPSALIDSLTGHVQRLIQELRLALSYVARKYPDAIVSTVLLTGGGANIKGIAEHITSHLEIACVRCDPSRISGNAEAKTGAERATNTDRPEMVPAVGLAMFEELA